jgi:hypothetical protein
MQVKTRKVFVSRGLSVVSLSCNLMCFSRRAAALFFLICPSLHRWISQLGRLC